jgi:hypothetical protein
MMEGKGMKNSYRVQANATNPDFEPESRIKEGIECAGFLLITFDEDGDPMTEAMAGVSIEKIARFIANGNGNIENYLRQAAIIAEAYIKAMKIEEAYRSNRKLERFRDTYEKLIRSESKKEEDEDQEEE